MARLPVTHREPAFDCLIRETGCTHGALVPKDVAVNRNGYYWTRDGKPFHSAGEVPAGYKVITRLRFGYPKSKEKALRLDKNGNILSMSLTATRRMSEETAQIFESLF